MHATNQSRFSRNVAYNVEGHCIYIEDGIEENNLFEYNFVAFVHPISTPANGGWSGGPEVTANSSTLINPSDTAACGYYILNSYNSFIGNAASGGWCGFAFPNAPNPIFSSAGLNYGYNSPQNRETKVFKGNSAHSTGFYWIDHGPAIYVGAIIYYNGNGDLIYSNGRYERPTMNSSGIDSWMIFTDTKTFLCNKGVLHWGKRAEMYRYENYDSITSVFWLGDMGLSNALIVGI
jgi:hypothetical protein